VMFLLFQLGKDRYALSIHDIVEVLPLVHWKTLPGAENGIAGVFNYHGAPVPLIDLEQLAFSRPSRKHVSTRIVVINSPDSSGTARPLGLIAEKTTAILRRDENDFVDSGVAVPDSPYLGSVTTDALGIIQRVSVRQLLPDAVLDKLFQQCKEMS
jgi:chemotaxis-related protein WspB